MALTASPFGFVLRKNQNGQSRAMVYTIASTYGTSIGYGDPVALDTNGTLVAASATNDLLGIFAGVEYTDASGKPVISKRWPASTTATNIKAYVYLDLNDVFEVQVGASGTGYVQAVIGAQADVVMGTPSAVTGMSTSYLNATPEAAGAQGQFRIIGFGPDGVYDATTNPFPTVLVQIAQSQYSANKVGI